MGEGRYVYAFEEVAEDLPRPPMAALRALHAMGFIVSPRGWQELPVDVRQTIASEGAKNEVGGPALEAALTHISLQHVKMMPKPREPDPLEVPKDLLAALGPLRRVSATDWQKLRALDRRVLNTLAHNTRLLARAIEEIFPTGTPSRRSTAVVARCEMTLRREVLRAVTDPDFQGGRAFILARVAGRRAARRVAEILDTQADSTVGPIELDWGVREVDSVLFWQAHASAWDGSFFPSAALLAATTAAVAIHDLLREIDPTATISAAGIKDEPWEAGRGEALEPATALYANLGPSVDRAIARGLGATLVTGPPVMDGALDGLGTQRMVPLARPSSQPVIPRALASSPSPVAGPISSPKPPSGLRVPSGPGTRVFVVVSAIAVLAVIGLIVVAMVLARSAGVLSVPGSARGGGPHRSTQ